MPVKYPALQEVGGTVSAIHWVKTRHNAPIL